MTEEQQVATQIVHQERIAAALARTGGEIIHPDHYDIREAIRIAVLRAIDETTEDAALPKMSDAELPCLFKALDAIAEKIFHRSVGHD